MIQGSDEWLRARAGSLGASQVHGAIKTIKSGGYAATRKDTLFQLVAERLTGEPTETFTSTAMQWGKDTESQARAAYTFLRNIAVQEEGLVRHPHIKGTHASPDGLVMDTGLLEIKCPNTAQHVDFLRTRSIKDEYLTQMQWQMACTNREWCDFASFDPRLPPELQISVKRVPRDDKFIAETEAAVEEFLEEVAATEAELRGMMDAEAAA
ncbi:lambda exonuclease family protein [Henriciella sp.]|uniref:lambda exonuclease family protein n=1 Tax=Henriciella sp. TaxID=1968823 RepID=UPI00261B97A5|nr:lambda exonuclease family protein [Henriciella sp.]